jgi:beta-lactamase class A
VSAARCEQIKELLRRDFADADNHNYQVRSFSSPALPKDAKLWSKAGWTNEARHDAAYIELPNGARFVLVTFTMDHANDHDIIPAVTRYIVNELGKEKK